MSECTRFEHYVNPFSGRYASSEMGFLFSDQSKYSTFRKLWLELATAQKKLGLYIPKTAIDQMKQSLYSIDFQSVNQFEKKGKHDVMAHIEEFGRICPKAAPYIHLGATSCFVTDNTDLILMKKALTLLQKKIVALCKEIRVFSKKFQKIPCVGYTHFQPAQPTTLGKRACLWLQDFLLDLQELAFILENLPFLGAKGATGTQSSFLHLFNGDHKKVTELDSIITRSFGFEKLLSISGQTYTRKIDVRIMNFLASFACSSHKFATDIRLLSHLKEVQEGRSKNQIGSSAMPHKQNPIYSERICGIARFLINLSQNSLHTASNQWLERTLDDSSNRRLVNPQAFLASDAILNLMYHVMKNIRVDQKIIQDHFAKEEKMLILENILMHATSKGENRQLIHEKLRIFAKKNQNLNLLTKDPELHLNSQILKKLSRKESFIGRSIEQTQDFLQNVVDPYLKPFRSASVHFSKIEI